MDKMCLVVIFALAVLFEFAPAQGNRECSSASDCEQDECCRVEMVKFSIPHCFKYGQVGDSCIPRNEMRDFDLHYPDGSMKVVTGGYRHYCPCQDGLTCHGRKCQG